jgi:hypothetical protein
MNDYDVFSKKLGATVLEVVGNTVVRNLHANIIPKFHRGKTVSSPRAEPLAMPVAEGNIPSAT